jgi:hypothetical protein
MKGKESRASTRKEWDMREGWRDPPRPPFKKGGPLEAKGEGYPERRGDLRKKERNLTPNPPKEVMKGSRGPRIPQSKIEWIQGNL